MVRLVICSLFLLGLTACSSLEYYPAKNLFYDPKQFDLKPDEIFFPSADGTKLFGWYFHNKTGQKPKATLIFYHGNAENLSSHYVALLWLLKEPYDFFIFDYRGYGRSEGTPNPKGVVEDGEAALRYIHNKFPEQPLVVFAQSVGGNIGMRNAIDLKDELPIKLVVADSTFTSFRSYARKVLSRSILTWPFQWIGWLALPDAHSPKGEVQKISPVPLIVIHGDKDEIVEFEFGERIFAEAKDPKEFWPIAGGRHIDSMSHFEIQKKFLARLNQLFAK